MKWLIDAQFPKGAMLLYYCVRINGLLNCNFPKCAIIFSCCDRINTIKMTHTPEFSEPVLRASKNALYQTRVLQNELKLLMLQKSRVYISQR